MRLILKSSKLLVLWRDRMGVPSRYTIVGTMDRTAYRLEGQEKLSGQ